MARIDLAYSLEIGYIVDAMEANELWMEGILRDKKAFECIDENCNAKITCKNMDTFADSRKKIPHFIMSNQTNMHSVLCKVYSEYEEKDGKKRNKKNGSDIADINKKVCFHMERPEEHRIIKHTGSGHSIKDDEDIRNTKKSARESRRISKSHYFWLHSLIGYYIHSYLEGKTQQNKVEVIYSNNTVYKYQLSNLFVRIEKTKENANKEDRHHVYYGKGKVYLREDGGYDLFFGEKFIDSEKKVKCVVSKKIIDNCKYGKTNKISILESAIKKERFIYVISKKKIDNAHGKVYLNVDNLDCIAISEVDLDALV